MARAMFQGLFKSMKFFMKQLLLVSLRGFFMFPQILTPPMIKSSLIYETLSIDTILLSLSFGTA